MACACFGPSNSKGQMKTIAKNFQLSVSGTDEQQKLAYGKQENDCDTLQVIFKGKEDNIGRMRAIEEGVVEGCIHIFETRELEQITQPFPEAFLVLTEPASTEINLLIYSKKPFQGLVRLLDHKDNRIVADAIRSLINIITAGSDSTPNKEPHPYYQSLQEIGAIEKLFKLQQNNEDKYVKDLAAVCIGVIFKAQELPQYKEQIIEQLKYLLIDNDEWMRNASKKAINCLVQNNANLTQILKGDFLKNMSLNLRQSISGNDEKNKNIQQQQEKDCKILQAVCENREDDQLRNETLNIGIIKEIINILDNGDINSIKCCYIEVIYAFITSASDQIKQKVYQLKPYNGLTRILQLNDNNICLESIKTINQLLKQSNSNSILGYHSHYDQLQECIGIEKMFALFQRNQVKDIKDYAAFCIGRIFYNKNIENAVMKNQVIIHLKKLTVDPKISTNTTSKDVLAGLAHIEVNRTEILKSDLIKNIVDELKQPLKGSEIEKQQLIQKQESSCQLIQSFFKSKLDDKGRLLIIESKIIEQLINIFEKRENNSITGQYSNAFLCIITPTTDANKLKVYQKKPYQGLLKLLDHSNSNVIEDSINSIFLILQSGSNTVQIQQQNPHYKQINGLGGIEKIFALYQKNINKIITGYSAISLSFIFKASEIANKQIKEEIINHLKVLIYDKDEQIRKDARIGLKLLSEFKANLEEILNEDFLTSIVDSLKTLNNGQQLNEVEQDKLQGRCELIIDLIQLKQDDEVRKIIMKNGIGELFIHLFEKQELNQITEIQTRTFFTLANGGQEIRQQLFELKPYPSLIHLLQHQDVDIQFGSIQQIQQFLFEGSINVPVSVIHPNYQEIQDIEGIKKILNRFNNTEHKGIKDHSAICLALIFKAREIEDSDMKQIIQFIKDIIFNQDGIIKERAKIGIKFIAENSVNCQEILKGDFLVNIADDLKQPLVGNEIQRNAIQKKQETDCEILYAILNDREDNEARQSSIDVGIVIELIKIFNSRKFSLVTEPYANVFMSLSGPANDLIKGQIVAMKVYQALIHMLDTGNSKVIDSIITSIDYLLAVDQNKDLDQFPHPHFSQIKQIKGVDKIYQIFKKKNMNNNIKNRSALSIGRLYCSQEISNQNMKRDVISHIQKLTEDQDINIQSSAYRRLLELSQNNGLNLMKIIFKI